MAYVSWGDGNSSNTKDLRGIERTTLWMNAKVVVALGPHICGQLISINTVVSQADRPKQTLCRMVKSTFLGDLPGGCSNGLLSASLKDLGFLKIQ